MLDSKTILCYGDSNTWGYISSTGGRYPESVRWTGVMARELGTDYQVVEAGLNGRTTVFDDPVAPGRNGYEFLHVTMASAAPLDAMIIWLGANDSGHACCHIHEYRAQAPTTYSKAEIHGTGGMEKSTLSCLYLSLSHRLI